jgi:hypothetical protein
VPLTRRAFLAALAVAAVPVATAAGYPPKRRTVVSDRLLVSDRLILRG